MKPLVKKYLAWPFRHRWRDDRRALLEFNRSLTLIADPDALMSSLAARIREQFAPDSVLILRAVDSGFFTVAFCTGQIPNAESIRLTPRDRLSKWLLTNETALVLSESPHIVSYLTEAEREMLAAFHVRVCVPLVALNRLTGMILLCAEAETWHPDREGGALLQMIAGQASIAFENAFLYQQQRDRLQRLSRAERLAAAGQLAASVAHEIRNPLTIIRSTVQYLASEFDSSNPKRSLVEAVISEVDRIDRTVDGLLGLTRGPEFKPKRLELRSLLDQTLLLVQSQGIKQSVEIAYSAGESDLFVIGDDSQLKQFFLNLVLNALQAMQGGGRLHVRLETRTEPAGWPGEKRWAHVLIEDTGCGIPPEHLERIFDPFFTTKQGGTGLGLSTSYMIARQHGGDVEIESSEGQGTSVNIRLPLVR
jgi:signal transduction histidine kinase